MSFEIVVNGLTKLHQLIKEGKDDSVEAELIRDSLDVPLRNLSHIEKDLVQQFSENLYKEKT